jgi:exonuclease SbcD
LFGAEAQAFMLGHIHRHQAWEQESRAGRQCIAYPGSIGRFHYGEEGEKGFLLWDRRRSGALCAGADARTPNVDIVFEGKPDLDALRTAVAQQDIAGAFVRVRWTVADEDRHEVDRAAIERLLGERRKPSWKGASCRWCARGRQGSRNWRIWRTRCVSGRR